MKKTFYILSLLTLQMLGMVSCSSEGDPTFQFTDPSENFQPKEGDDEAIAKLRQDFQAATGNYLLFNDTLQHVYLGKDINGDDKYFTELLDIKYEVGQTSSYQRTTYSYTNLKSYEKCLEATNYLKQYILPHLSSKLAPFSWYLTSVIYGKVDGGSDVRPYAVSGQRCIILSCKYLPQLKTEEKKQQLAKRHLLVIIQSLASNNAPSFADFTAVSSKYYNTDFSTEELTRDLTEVVREKGFISTVSNASHPRQENDINAFTSLVMSYSDEQIETRYANYPLIVQKAKMFRKDLINLGYIF